jgi:hypothetical protein
MMANIVTSSKPLKIGQVVDILKDTMKDPNLANKNLQLFKMKGGTGYVFHSENRTKKLDWKSDLYRFGE